MPTPEGKVKAQVKKLLQQHDTYCFWPVQSGYGTFTLDCLGCHKGRFFAIETKAPGKKATPMQSAIGVSMESTGAKVFTIDGSNLEELIQWLSTPTA